MVLKSLVMWRPWVGRAVTNQRRGLRLAAGAQVVWRRVLKEMVRKGMVESFRPPVVGPEGRSRLRLLQHPDDAAAPGQPQARARPALQCEGLRDCKTLARVAGPPGPNSR